MTPRSSRNAAAFLFLSIVASAAHAGLDRAERAIARHAAEGQAAAEVLLQRV